MVKLQLDSLGHPVFVSDDVYIMHTGEMVFGPVSETGESVPKPDYSITLAGSIETVGTLAFKDPDLFLAGESSFLGLLVLDTPDNYVTLKGSSAFQGALSLGINTYLDFTGDIESLGQLFLNFPFQQSFIRIEDSAYKYIHIDY